MIKYQKQSFTTVLKHKCQYIETKEIHDCGKVIYNRFFLWSNRVFVLPPYETTLSKMGWSSAKELFKERLKGQGYERVV